MLLLLNVLPEVDEVRNFDEMHNVNELYTADVLHENLRLMRCTRSVGYTRLMGCLVVNICPPSCEPHSR